MKKQSISKKTQTIIIVIPILVMLVVGLCIIGIVPKDKIIMISRYRNYAWGYVDQGSFLDSSGNLYYFSFDKAYSGSQQSDEAELRLMEKLEIIRDYTEPCGKVPLSAVRKIYMHGMMIPIFNIYKEKVCSVDGGASSIYFRNPLTGRMAMCRTVGDVEKISWNWNARRVVDIVKEETGDIERDYSSGNYVTSDEITIATLDCENIEESKKYRLINCEQLRALEKKHGFNMDSMWAKMDEYDKYRYVFLVEFIKTDTPEKIPKAMGVLKIDGNLDFVVDGNRADAVGNEAGDGQGVCYVAAYPYDDSIFYPDHCYDWDGQEWILPTEGDVISDPLTYRGILYGASKIGMRRLEREYRVYRNLTLSYQGLGEIFIHSAEEYEHFVAFCDQNDFWEDENILTDSCFSGDYQPDFSKVSLRICFGKAYSDSEIKFERIRVTRDEISLGFEIDRKEHGYTESSEDIIIYTYIPKQYILKDGQYYKDYRQPEE